MTKTVYIGMDVHSTNYTLSSYTCEADNCFSTVKLGPDVKNILKYISGSKRIMEMISKSSPVTKLAALDTLFIRVWRRKVSNVSSSLRLLFRSRNQVRSKPINVMHRKLPGLLAAVHTSLFMFPIRKMMISNSTSVCVTIIRKH